MKKLIQDIIKKIKERKEGNLISEELKNLIEYSINIGAFDFLLENITKSENLKHLNKAKISEKDITFVLGQEPYIEDSSSKRIFSIMKNVDMETKNCILRLS